MKEEDSTMIKKFLDEVFNKALTVQKAADMLKSGLPEEQVKTALGLLSFFGITNYVGKEGKEMADILTNLIKAAKATIAKVTAAIEQAPNDLKNMMDRIRATRDKRQAVIQKAADDRKQAVSDKTNDLINDVIEVHQSEMLALKVQLIRANNQLTDATNQMTNVKKIVQLFS